MANQDFLGDKATGTVMGRKMVVGWAGGQAQFGDNFCVIQRTINLNILGLCYST